MEEEYSKSTKALWDGRAAYSKVLVTMLEKVSNAKQQGSMEIAYNILNDYFAFTHFYIERTRKGMEMLTKIKDAFTIAERDRENAQTLGNDIDIITDRHINILLPLLTKATGDILIPLQASEEEIFDEDTFFR